MVAVGCLARERIQIEKQPGQDAELDAEIQGHPPLAQNDDTVTEILVCHSTCQ